MPDVGDMTVYDDAESDIIAWPSDRRGRVINYRMTPQRARQLAGTLRAADLDGWRQIVEALEEAARRSSPPRSAGPHGLGRLPDPIPRIARAPAPDSSPSSGP